MASKSKRPAPAAPKRPVGKPAPISPAAAKQASGKPKQAQVKDDATDKEAAPETTQDSPLLDLSDAAVRKMIKLAKKRGYVTYESLNAVLPSEEVTSEQIEDILAMLNEMGINVIEQEEATEEDEEARGEEADEDDGDGELVEVAQKTPAKAEKAEPSERTVRPLCLAYFGPVWLLSAWCELRDDFRTFRLDRIADFAVPGDRFRHEPGKTLHDFLKRDHTWTRSRAAPNGKADHAPNGKYGRETPNGRGGRTERTNPARG